MWVWVLLALWLTSWLCIPHLLLLNKRPTATLAWLWAILLFPVVGAGLYLAIGSERVARRRQEQGENFRSRKRLTAARSKTAEGAAGLEEEKALGQEDRLLLRGLSTITQLPVATASSVRILYKGAPYYAALREDIEKAERDVHVESFIWRDDEVGAEFLQLLVETARRGVSVRLLLDELGCIRLHDRYFKPLIAAGGEFSWCHTLSPLRNRYSFNLRNHRKLQIIDGRTVFIGGMNFGREYLGRDPKLGDWADAQLRVQGRVVEVFQQIFAEDWFFATGRENPLHHPPQEKGRDEKILAQVLRGGPDEDDHAMLRSNLLLVAAAKERLWISTGYFVPGETMQTALQVVAAKGVDVRLLVSAKSQHPHLVSAGRSYYDALLRQGVRIFEYSRGINHSKFMIIDDGWSTVGSSNLDERSMRLNFELNLLMHHPETNRELSRIFEESVAGSKEIDIEEFDRRPLSQKLLESTLRPLSPIL
jgi:cardiolipin synthase A/B